MTSVDNHTALFSSDELEGLFGQYSIFRRIALGVSGGADSMALLYLMKQWCLQAGKHAPALYAFTVDHGLRKEAEHEAAGVARYCAHIDVPHKILNWVGDKPSSNVQSEAREARFALLRKAAEESSCEALFLAHHLEDQAETFLTRLARGSGVYGLAGMRPERELDGIHLCRPLLNVSKVRLKAVLTDARVPWFEDPSNDDTQYTRVKFRKAQKRLDKLGLTALKLADTAQRMTRAADALDTWVDEVAEKSCTFHSAGPVRFDSSCLEYLPDEIGLRLIARLIRYVSGAAYTPRLAKLQSVVETLSCDEGARAATLGGVQFARAKPHDESIWFCFREAGRMGLPNISVQPGDEGVWDARWQFFASSSAEPFRIACVHDAQIGDFELEIPTNWPKSAFLTTPVIVFADGVSYMPWKKIGRTPAAAEVRSRISGISMAPVRKTF